MQTNRTWRGYYLLTTRASTSKSYWKLSTVFITPKDFNVFLYYHTSDVKRYVAEKKESLEN